MISTENRESNIDRMDCSSSPKNLIDEKKESIDRMDLTDEKIDSCEPWTIIDRSIDLPVLAAEDYLYVAPTAPTTRELLLSKKDTEFEFPCALNDIIFGSTEMDTEGNLIELGGFRNKNTGEWDTNRLFDQIEKDMPRWSLIVNGKQYTDLLKLLNEEFIPSKSIDEFLEQLKTQSEETQKHILSCLCCFQQGAGVIGIKALESCILKENERAFMGNTEFEDGFATHVNATFDKKTWQIKWEHHFRVFDNDNYEAPCIPVIATINYSSDKSTTVKGRIFEGK